MNLAKLENNKDTKIDETIKEIKNLFQLREALKLGLPEWATLKILEKAIEISSSATNKEIEVKKHLINENLDLPVAVLGSKEKTEIAILDGRVYVFLQNGKIYSV